MTESYRRVLWVCAGSLVVLAALAVAASLTVRPDLPADLRWFGVGALWGVWMPTLAGCLLIWLLAPRDGQERLDRRTEAAMAGHPIAGELAVLVACLAAYIAAGIGLFQLFELVIPEIMPGTALPVARAVFLFCVPVLLVDRAGYSLTGHGTEMPSLAMWVGEPWRWFGLAAVAAALAFILVDVRAVVVPPLPIAIFGLLGVGAIAMVEEIFFRGMVQTRLELLAGRLPAVVVTALLYAAAHSVSGYYTSVSPIGSHGFVVGIGSSVLTYGATGLLLGYLWIRYRNIWINALLHGTLLLAGLVPLVFAVRPPGS